MKCKTKCKSEEGEEDLQALCLECGLCCNGVLFADVRLQDGDKAEKLRGWGWRFRKAGVLDSRVQHLKGASAEFIPTGPVIAESLSVCCLEK